MIEDRLLGLLGMTFIWAPAGVRFILFLLAGKGEVRLWFCLKNSWSSVLFLRFPDDPAIAGGVKRLKMFDDAGVALCLRTFDPGVVRGVFRVYAICLDAGVPWLGVVCNRENMVESERMPVGEAKGGEALGVWKANGGVVLGGEGNCPVAD